MTRAPKLPRREPWAAPQYDDFDTGSIKAVANGRASEHQQMHAMRLIVENIAGTYDQSFRPGALDGQRASDFAEGRRFVGLQLVKLINLDTGTKSVPEPR